MKQIIKEPNGRVRVITINTEPTKTQQQFTDQCDVNKIVAKYKTTGQFQHLTNKQGVYADFTKVTDYHGMMNTVLNAQNAFGSLPSHLRARFENDPGKLLAFLQDPNNRDEAIKLGLIDKPSKSSSEPINANNNDEPNDDAKREKAPKGTKQNSTSKAGE